LLELKLHLTDREQSRFYGHRRANASMKGTKDRFPPIYFVGTSKGVKSITDMEGVVYMSPDGVVRWEFVSRYLISVPQAADFECFLHRVRRTLGVQSGGTRW